VKTRILIIGGNGFLATNFAQAMRDKHEIHLADINFSETVLKSFSSTFKLDVTNGTQVENVVLDIEPDVICHFAARVSFRWSLDEPRGDLFLHALGTLNVLEAARKVHPIPHVVYASSSAIFGEAKIVPTPEDCPPNPTSPMGVTKLAGENYCRVYHQVYGMPVSILRFTNIYGPMIDHGVISIFLKRVLSRQLLTIFGGDQMIQFVYVSDAVKAIQRVIEKRVIGTFNIGGPDVITLRHLADLIVKEAGVDVPIEIKPPVAGDIQKIVFDLTKAKEELDWQPQVSIQEGLRKYINECRIAVQDQLPQTS